MHLTGLINELLNRNQEFVSYRLPSEAQPVSLIGGSFKRSSTWQSLKTKTGFFVAPFVAQEQTPFLFYDNGKEHTGWNLIINLDEFFNKPLSGKEKHTLPEAIDFKQYIRQADRLVKLMRAGELTKIVLSRVLVEALPGRFSAGEFFKSLCEKYPAAFVYFFNDGKGTCWAGATPETLLEAENRKANTMSLAGTLPAKRGGSPENEWQDKELEEQKLVTLFIREKLINNGIQDFVEVPLEVREAGPVVHLLKRFHFDLPHEVSALQMAMSLHPTPAVCGLPVEQALHQIQKTETYQRGYYAGVIGPISNKHSARLFVNLRCMQLIEKNALIFAGGGLLAESDIEREWQETALKAETLLSVIRQFD